MVRVFAPEKWLFKILFLRHILSLYSNTTIIKEKPFNNCSPVFDLKRKTVHKFLIFMAELTFDMSDD